MRIERAGLRLQAGRDFESSTPRTTRASASYWEAYHQPDGRATASRPRWPRRRCGAPTPLIASLMVQLGDADAMLCGLVGRFDSHLEHVRDVIGVKQRRADWRR